MAQSLTVCPALPRDPSSAPAPGTSGVSTLQGHSQAHIHTETRMYTQLKNNTNKIALKAVGLCVFPFSGRESGGSYL